MNSIVILFILGLVVNFQEVDVCNTRDAYIISSGVKKKASADMKDFSGYIDRLKTDYIQELIDLKFKATFNDIQSLVEYGKLLNQEKTNGRRKNHELMIECMDRLTYDIVVTFKNFSEKYRQCVREQFDTQSALADDFHKFLDGWSSCPLDIDPVSASLCSRRQNAHSEICNLLEKHLNSSNQMPLECSEDYNDSAKKHLEVYAKRLAVGGISDASKCISKSQQNFNESILFLINTAKDCENA